MKFTFRKKVQDRSGKAGRIPDLRTESAAAVRGKDRKPGAGTTVLRENGGKPETGTADIREKGEKPEAGAAVVREKDGKPESAEAVVRGKTGRPEFDGTEKKESDYEQRKKYARRLANEILAYTRDRLIVRMPYFNRAVLKMPVVFYRDGFRRKSPEGFGTNGQRIICNPYQVIRMFREEPASLLRVYLHMLLHCVFHHPFQYGRMNSDYWDFAVDLAVEHVILELGWEEIRIPGDPERIGLIEIIHQKAGKITAENLYHYFYMNPKEARPWLNRAKLFRQDIHGFWIPEEFSDNQEVLTKDSQEKFDQTESEWGRIGKSLKMDMDAFVKNQGFIPDVLKENIRAVDEKRHSYREFLRKFTVSREEMKINEDEFDYICYTYGLELYKNMPLIEPLEYQEENRIHDFVIAVDTSGSTQGRTVRNFLNETYTVLHESGAFFKDMNVHIVQCDSRIQQDAVVHNEEEFESYMSDIELHGAGGTDFRPVFRYVEELRKSGEIRDLKGLLYFTDGLGTFPEKMPSYKTAFLFLKGKEEIKNVPPWAITMELAEEDFARSDRDYEEIPDGA